MFSSILTFLVLILYIYKILRTFSLSLCVCVSLCVSLTHMHMHLEGSIKESSGGHVEGNYTFVSTHTHTRTHAHKAYNSCVEHSYCCPALGCLCTTQELEPCAGKSSWGRTSNTQEDWSGLTERSQRPQHCYMRQGQLGICLPSLHQVSIDVTAATRFLIYS